jgi:hypothetical protein
MLCLCREGVKAIAAAVHRKCGVLSFSPRSGEKVASECEPDEGQP